MSADARLLAVAVGLLIVLAACGSNGATTGPTASPGAGASEAPIAPAQPTTAAAEPTIAPAEPTPAPTPAQPAPGQQDPSTIDWATVDLTRIDWATVDMSQVDWRAAGGNPTARTLTAEMQELIQSRIDPGGATLTIGDETWEFDNFVCAFGHENTESETYSFTTDSRGEFDGVRVQMQVTIADDAGEGRVEGSGTTHRLSFNDVSDFENPSIDWSLSGADAIGIDGNEVTVEGVFDDQLTVQERESVPGTLEATCGDMSRR